MLIWCLSDGSAGMAAQARALALALGDEPVMKKVAVAKIWDWLPTMFYAGPVKRLVPKILSKDSDALTPPWPDIVISCGRRAALIAIGLKPLTGARTRFVHIHSPQTSLKQFDAVVAMQHDSLKGANVIKTHFALHAVTPARMEEARRHFASRFAAFPQPQVAVLLGGSTNRYKLTPEAMAPMIMALQRLLQSMHGSLLVTPSRRTGLDNIAMLRGVFNHNPRVYIYDEFEENPYFGILALADAIVVTNDSVNMLTDAHATGKPFYVLTMPGHADTKQARFAEKLIRDGIAKPFNGRLETWNYSVDDEMPRVAAEVRRRLGLP